MCNCGLLNFKGGLVDLSAFLMYNEIRKGGDLMNIGEKIYQLRTEKNLSQGDLADMLNVSRQSVSKWENNVAVPDLDKLIKLCDVFEISLDELTGREKREEKNRIIEQGSSFSSTKIAGYVLLGVTILSAIILLVTAPTGIYLCIPLLLCTIICFKVKKYAWFWCMWIVYLLLEAVLCTGFRPDVMHISKSVFLILMTILNIACIKDVPAISKNKRMIILIMSELLMLVCVTTIGVMFYINNTIAEFAIVAWQYCIVYVGLTASIGMSIYHIIGFIREAKLKKQNK